MKRFLLLRNNQETGPYSLEELQAFGLNSSDLVWVEGKSTAWDYPTNIEELKGYSNLVSSGNILYDNSLFTSNSTIPPTGEVSTTTENFTHKRGLPNTAETFPTLYNEEPEQGLKVVPPRDESTSKTEKRKRNGFFTTYGAWITALFLLLAGTTWVLKKAFDVFSGKGVYQNAQTSAVTPLKTLPEDLSPRKEDDANIQNALSREIVPVDTSQVKEPIKIKPRLKELKKYVQVKSNAYKVGIFGGINDLQLTVFNNSPYVLDKVVLQVDYLKPKGESIQTEKYTYFSIPPHGKKTLDIPPTKRGVKVKYRITDAVSHEYKVAFIQA